MKKFRYLGLLSLLMVAVVLVVYVCLWHFRKPTYPVTVNYARTVEDIAKHADFYLDNWYRHHFNSRDIPVKRTGIHEVTVEIVHFNREISTDEALRELDRMGLRPADLHELLAYGEKYRKPDSSKPVAALDSFWVWPGYNLRHYPYLGAATFRGWSEDTGHKCGEVTLYYHENWDSMFRFAAVRK